MNGIYAMYYTGVAGSGHAVSVMKDGVIVGSDATGVVLYGRAFIQMGEYSIQIQQHQSQQKPNPYPPPPDTN